VRVLRPPGCDLAKVVGQRRLQAIEGVGARDPHGAEVADVERGGPGAAGAVLGQRARRVLDRHVPAAERDHLGAEGAVAGIEGRDVQRHGPAG
jgi:hypothetical protein